MNQDEAFLYVILHNVSTNFTSILVTKILYLQVFVIMKVATWNDTCRYESKGCTQSRRCTL